ncbi:MAG TPA: hypothetical protein VG937_03155 [Polyangiaceae bacterium]|nr:hypothetical protein [Polyangiaceae bacterium]
MSTPADCVQHQSSANAGCVGCEPLDDRRVKRGSVAGALAASLVTATALTSGVARAEDPAPPPAAAAPAPTPTAAAPASVPAAPASAAPAPPPAPKTAIDSLPGSPRPLGPSLSPEAPPVPAAPGGRAPSFGAPTDVDAWSFRLGGKISGYQSIGFGNRPTPAGDGQASTPLHVPPRITGRTPFATGGQLTLNLSYGTAIIGGFVTYSINTVGKEYAGYYQASAGAAANSAFVLFTPQSLGALRLQVKAGAFVESYAGVGQWGWGVLGPLLGTRGYGEVVTAEYDLSSDFRLFAAHGLFAVPGVPEFFVRGSYTGWNETGVSTMMQHGHIGLNYKGKYVVKLHAANAAGTDERKFLATGDPLVRIEDIPECQPDRPAHCDTAPRDGRIDIFAIESQTFLNQWGHVGVAAAYYNLVTAGAVHDGVWWTVDWTQGARETTNNYLGLHSGGTGKFFAISAQYDFSLASVLWHPQPFDGRGPDVRVAIAGIYHQTLSTDEEAYDKARGVKGKFEKPHGYQFGLDLEYRMLPWLSSTLRSYGTYRNPSTKPSVDSSLNSNGVTQVGGRGRFATYSITPGLSFRTDWQAPERIEIAYTRFFYSDFTDANPAYPYDKDVVTVGAQVSF